MILRASWRPVRVRYKGKAISLIRGNSVSVRDMAEAMDRDKAWVRLSSSPQKSLKLLTLNRVPGLLLITIVGCDRYGATEGDVVDFGFYAQKQNLDTRRSIPVCLRTEVFLATAVKCRYCGGVGPFHIDHIIPWSKRGLHRTRKPRARLRLLQPQKGRKGTPESGFHEPLVPSLRWHDARRQASARRNQVEANHERVLWVWGAILESAAEIDDNGRYDLTSRDRLLL